MTALTRIESLALNETLDDAENLEEIYRSLALQPVSSSCASSGGPMVFSESESHVSLAELADAIRSLVDRKLLIVRHDPAQSPANNDLSYVWRCWFEASPEARELYDQSNKVRSAPA